MSHTFIDAPAASRPSLLSRMIIRVSALNARRLTIRELERLSDRELRDIGITRHDIGRIGDETASEILARS